MPPSFSSHNIHLQMLLLSAPLLEHLPYSAHPTIRKQNRETDGNRIGDKELESISLTLHTQPFKMSQIKDSAIKLFGKTIQLCPTSDDHTAISAAARVDVDCELANVDEKSLLCSKQGENREEEKSSTIDQSLDTKQEDELSSTSELGTSKTTNTEKPRIKEDSSQDHSKKEDHSDQTSSDESQDQNPPRKPDKILPCPRCTSMDTKFCYFNNYNVNQPRHFCKNCQRYWTAGGTMRNVPVGSGRRRSKNNTSAFHHRHLIIHPATGPTSDPPPPIPNYVQNGFIRPQSYNQIAWQSGYPVSFYSAAPYWACNSAEMSNLQLLPTISYKPDESCTTSCSKSASLGKHSRDGTILRPSTQKSASSDWGRAFFKGLQQSRDTEHDCYRNNATVHKIAQANPTAMSRSASFHEIAQLGC